MVKIKEENKKMLYEDEVTKEYSVKFEKRKKGMKISILSDPMFKAMFYQENRIKYSCKFLSYFLDISYEKLLEILKLGKGELDKNKEIEKAERSDYVAYIDHTAINIEVNCNDNILSLERNMEYAHRLYSREVKRGSKYLYTQVIQFNLNNFAFKNNPKIVDYYYVQNDEKTLLHDKLIFVQIYIPNLRKKWYTSGVENLSERERFLLTLVEPEIEVSKEIGKGDIIMEEYINEAITVSEDDCLGEAYDKEWAMKDLGYREGKIETEKQIVKNMLKKGMNIPFIMEVTGLTKQETQKYQNENL